MDKNGCIIKNRGESWQRVLEDLHYFTALHVSSADPGRVYAGGDIQDGDRPLHLFVSDDGDEVFYLATTHGVYRYRPPD